MVIAGEASGDQHAALVISEAQQRIPDLHFFGIGGENMRRSGVEVIVDSAQMAVVGLFEVLAHFRTLYAALEQMRQLLRQRRPQLLLLVDYPDFNLRLAKSAKALGIPVLYYISPQIWAWRQHRVHTIKKRVDHMAVIFPFEVPFYRDAGVPVTFVGHPLRDEVNCTHSVAEARKKYQLGDQEVVIGLFPGSRRSELKRLLPLLLESGHQLQQKIPKIRFLLPLASTLGEEDIQSISAFQELKIEVTQGDIYRVMRSCDLVITASGTVTLELALLETPMIVIYRVNPLSYKLMSRMIRVKHIALCNIVAGERVVPELIQDDATPEKIASTAIQLIEAPEKRKGIQRQLGEIRERLGSGDCSGGVVNLIASLLPSTQ
ncbi:MAG: lipid-A-disaccharide synthase [Gammaproteobacteria bacterium]|nr:lipid-A-disaccharide synthase [Gammaproteobacteria bacterium]